MPINEKDLSNINLYGTEKSFLKKYNDIYISLEQIDILKKYNINIENYKTFESLMYDIESYLNDSYEILDDLEWVSESLQEYNYYNRTNK